MEEYHFRHSKPFPKRYASRTSQENELDKNCASVYQPCNRGEKGASSGYIFGSVWDQPTPWIWMVGLRRGWGLVRQKNDQIIKPWITWRWNVFPFINQLPSLLKPKRDMKVRYQTIWRFTDSAYFNRSSQSERLWYHRTILVMITEDNLLSLYTIFLFLTAQRFF